MLCVQARQLLAGIWKKLGIISAIEGVPRGTVLGIAQAKERLLHFLKEFEHDRVPVVQTPDSSPANNDLC